MSIKKIGTAAESPAQSPALTPSLYIRAAEPRDAAGLARLADDDASMLDFGFPRYANHAWWSRRTCREPEAGVCLVAEMGEDIAAWGELVLDVRSQRRHVGQLAVCVHASFRQRGLGRLLVETLLDLADRSYNLFRVELHVWEQNLPAIQLYQSLGFSTEGHHPGFGILAGQPAAALSMARFSRLVGAIGSHDRSCSLIS